MAHAGPHIFLISRDAALAQALFTVVPQNGMTHLAQSIEQAAETAACEHSQIIVADIDATRREELVGLQKLMIRLGGRVPVIVLTEAFDEAVGRWFLQIRVSDFLRKPLRPEEVLQACLRALKTDQGSPVTDTKILCFVPAAGGVGNTTLAVESAMQLHQDGATKGKRTCLVDLDFHNDACADFLDLEPRLDLKEIGAQGERLDTQLLEVMFSQHASGLTLIAAPAQPGQTCQLKPQAILHLLDVIVGRFDNVVIDLPRVWAEWTDDVLAGANDIYVVTDMTVPGLRFARRLANGIETKLSNCVKPKVIVNRFEKRALFGDGLSRTDVEKALNGSFAGVVGNNYQLVREAIDRGIPLQNVKPGNNVSADLRRIIFPAA